MNQTFGRPTGTQRKTISVSDVVVSGIVVLFLSAGNYKAISILVGSPIDLTVAFAVVLLITLMVAVARRGLWIPRELGLVILVFVAFIPALALSPLSEYSSEKVSRLFTLTLLAALAPLWLISTRTRVRSFLHWLAVVGVLLALLGVLQGSNPLVASGQLVIPGGNPIQLGRVSGAALIWIGILGFYRVIPRIFALPLCAFLVTAMFASGSRGPVLAAGFAILLLAMVIPGNMSNRMIRLGAISAIGIAATWYGLSQAPDVSIARFQLLTGADPGPTIRIRELLYEQSLALIPENPLGLGWGNFSSRVVVVASSLPLTYPHNILLEVTLEGGWLAGIALLLVLFVAVRRSAKTVDHPEGTALFALLTYFIANALVSGDINDNRILFSIIAACLVYGQVRVAAIPVPSKAGVGDG